MQVADWLFEHLRLPEVQVKSQGSAKTHRPTNDPVLQELVRKTGHPAPSMVLEHRYYCVLVCIGDTAYVLHMCLFDNHVGVIMPCSAGCWLVGGV